MEESSKRRRLRERRSVVLRAKGRVERKKRREKRGQKGQKKRDEGVNGDGGSACKGAIFSP